MNEQEFIDREFDERLRAAFDPTDSELRSADRVQVRFLNAVHERQRRRWLWFAAAPAFAAILAAIVVAPRLLRQKPDERVFADAQRDHTVEVVDKAPRHWRYDTTDIAALEASQGISAQDVSAIAAKGYALVRAKICGLAGHRYMHLVYARNGREISVYMRPKLAQPLPDSDAVNGAVRLSSFSRERVQVVVAGDVKDSECERLAEDARRAL